MSIRCTTHFHACDCREEYFKELESKRLDCEDKIGRLKKEVMGLEYRLEQQKIMNPISVNMIATIADLSAKLKTACEALEFYGDKNNYSPKYLRQGIIGSHGKQQMFIDSGKRAREALEIIRSESDPNNELNRVMEDE